MAVQHQATGSAVANATTATLTLVAPACAADDILIAHIVGKDNLDFTPPDGTWTPIVEANNTTAQRVSLFWKRATGSGGSFNFVKSSDNNILCFGVISAWRGCITTGSPIDATAPSESPNASADPVAYAAFNPAAACHVVAMGAYNNDLTTAGSISGTNPTFANVYDVETGTGTDASLFCYSGDSDGADTGARSHATTSSADAISFGVMFGLVAAPEGQSPAQDAIVTDADTGFDQAVVPGAAAAAQDAIVADTDTSPDQAVLAGGVTIAQDATMTEADEALDQGLVAAATPAQDDTATDADTASDATVSAGGVTIAQDAHAEDADTAFDGLVALTLEQDAPAVDQDTATDAAVTAGGAALAQDAAAQEGDTAFDQAVLAGGSSPTQDAPAADVDTATDAAIAAGAVTLTQDATVADADTAFDQDFAGEGDQTLVQDTPALEADTTFDAAVVAASSPAQDQVVADQDAPAEASVAAAAAPAQDAVVTDADTVFDAGFPSVDQPTGDHDEAFDAAVASGTPTDGVVRTGVVGPTYSSPHPRRSTITTRVIP